MSVYQNPVIMHASNEQSQFQLIILFFQNRQWTTNWIFSWNSLIDPGNSGWTGCDTSYQKASADKTKTGKIIFVNTL